MLRNKLVLNVVEVGNASELTLGNGGLKSEGNGGFYGYVIF